MVLIVTPRPRLRVVLPFPALLKVAVSPLPGTVSGLPLQFVERAQAVLVVPFQVALVAINEEAPPKRNENATKRNFAVHRKIGEAPEKRRRLRCKLLIISILFDPAPFFWP